MARYKIYVHPDGRIESIEHPALERFTQQHGTKSSLKRASHIEPCSWWIRQVFHVLRRLGGEYGRLAAFTRSWKCCWRVDLRLSGGPITDCDETGVPFARDRQRALDFEVRWLNANYLGRPSIS